MLISLGGRSLAVVVFVSQIWGFTDRGWRVDTGSRA